MLDRVKITAPNKTDTLKKHFYVPPLSTTGVVEVSKALSDGFGCYAP